MPRGPCCEARSKVGEKGYDEEDEREDGGPGQGANLEVDVEGHRPPMD